MYSIKLWNGKNQNLALISHYQISFLVGATHLSDLESKQFRWNPVSQDMTSPFIFNQPLYMYLNQP